MIFLGGVLYTSVKYSTTEICNRAFLFRFLSCIAAYSKLPMYYHGYLYCHTIYHMFVGKQSLQNKPSRPLQLRVEPGRAEKVLRLLNQIRITEVMRYELPHMRAEVYWKAGRPVVVFWSLLVEPLRALETYW